MNGNEANSIPNKFPGALFLKLYYDPIKKYWIDGIKSYFQEDITKKHEIKLTLRFGQQKMLVPLLGGTVTFGLTGGTLKLKLRNSIMPIETIETINLSSLLSESETQQEQTIETKMGLSLSLFQLFKFDTEKKDTQKKVAKLKTDNYLTETAGTENEPIWIFPNTINQRILKGLLKKEKLGILNLTNEPFEIQGLFIVRDEDLQVTDTDILLLRSIGRNKQSWLVQEIFLHFIRPEIESYLSKVEVSYE